MRVVGLTGGIGSGKSTIARFFENLGISIYYSDDVAKELSISNSSIYNSLKKKFGNAVCSNGNINKSLLTSIIFSDSKKLKILNEIVHPEVKKNFEYWLKNAYGKYIIKETAILFESGTHKDCDAIITVTAPFKDRICRLKSQRGLSERKILKIINRQWNDEDRLKLSDYIIHNVDLQESKKEVISIHSKLLDKFATFTT